MQPSNAISTRRAGKHSTHTADPPSTASSSDSPIFKTGLPFGKRDSVPFSSVLWVEQKKRVPLRTVLRHDVRGCIDSPPVPDVEFERRVLHGAELYGKENRYVSNPMGTIRTGRQESRSSNTPIIRLTSSVATSSSSVASGSDPSAFPPAGDAFGDADLVASSP